MSALLFAVPLSILVGALKIIRRDQADHRCAVPVTVPRTAANNVRRHAGQRMDCARRRSQS